MSATVLEFRRRQSAPPQPADATPRPAGAVLEPTFFDFARPQPRTPRQVAHRWAMLAHLLRHRSEPPRTVR